MSDGKDPDSSTDKTKSVGSFYSTPERIALAKEERRGNYADWNGKGWDTAPDLDSKGNVRSSVGSKYSDPDRRDWARDNNVGAYGDPNNPSHNANLSSAARDAAFSAHQAGAAFGGFGAPGASDYGDALGALSEQLENTMAVAEARNRYEQLMGQLEFFEQRNTQEIAQGTARSQAELSASATAEVGTTATTSTETTSASASSTEANTFSEVAENLTSPENPELGAMQDAHVQDFLTSQSQNSVEELAAQYSTTKKETKSQTEEESIFTLENAGRVAFELSPISSLFEIHKGIEEDDWGKVGKGAFGLGLDVLGLFTGGAFSVGVRAAAYMAKKTGFALGLVDAAMGVGKPVIIDLDGDGVELVPLSASATIKDLDDDGYKEATGWVSADDGLLVIDLDADGIIDQTKELVLTEWAEEASTDLEALQLAFDTNNDLTFNALDDQFASFRIWQDLDLDGEADEGELQTLEDAGLVSIDLSYSSIDDAPVWTDNDGDGVIDDGELSAELAAEGAAVIENRDGNLIYRSTSIEWNDDREGKAYDTAFQYISTGIKRTESEGNIEIEYDDGSKAIQFTGTESISLALGASGYYSVFGGSGNDDFHVIGDEQVVIDGGGGDDAISGSSSDDVLSGGAGADTINAGAGHDLIIFDADDAPSAIDGGEGYDVAYAEGLSPVSIDLGASNLEGLYGNVGNDTIYTTGDEGVLIQGDDGDDSITGGSGNDLLAGGDGADTLQGGVGNDIIFMDAEDLTANVDGGEGEDTLYISDTESVVINLTDSNFEAGRGGSGDDMISATGDDNVSITGGDGNDSLSGGSGKDSLYGEVGDDTLSGGAGSDVLDGGVGNDLIESGAGEDLIKFGKGYGQDIVENAGEDFIYLNSDVLLEDLHFSKADNDLVLTLRDTTDTLTLKGWFSGYQNQAKGFVLSSSDLVDPDYVYVLDDNTDTYDFDTSKKWHLITLGGNDNITGGTYGDFFDLGEGDDIAKGGDGDDTLLGGAGSDSLDGQEGSDVASYVYSDEGVNIDLSLGTASGGQADGDTLTSIENIIGSANDDSLIGTNENNAFVGLDGDDSISGLEGEDFLKGGAGADTLSGGADDDNLYGADGADSLLGGTGADFVLGEDGNDWVDAGEGEDTVYGGHGFDTILGGAGNDEIDGGASGDVLIGGDGIDRLKYHFSDQAVSINLETGEASGGFADGDIISGFENIGGTFYDDTLEGNEAANEFYSDFGNDLLTGNGGDDLLQGGVGEDTAVYAGVLDGYDLSIQGGFLRVEDLSGSEGVDSLQAVETLQFSDRDITVLETGMVMTGMGAAVDGRVSDASHGTVTYVLDNLPENGTVVFDAEGDYTYTPNATYAGGDTFSYKVVNEDGLVSLGQVAVVVEGEFFKSTEVEVNSYTEKDQYTPSIAGINNGGFITVWASEDQDGSGMGIYGQRYSDNGYPEGDDFRINTETDSGQYQPVVVGLDDGGFAVVWTSSNQDGSGNGVFGQRFNESGEKEGVEFQINTGTFNHQHTPSLASLGDKGFVVTWSSQYQDGSGYGVYGQRFDLEGEKLGDEFLVNTETSADQFEPTLAALADGAFVISWTSENQDGSKWGVFAQRFDSEGAASGDEFQVNTYTADNQHAPCLASLSDGGFVTVWTSYEQDGSGYGVYGQRYDAEGVVVGDEFQINTYTQADQNEPQVIGLLDGGFAVSWTSQNQDGDGFGVYCQRYDAAGETVDAEFLVNTFTASDQHDSALTILNDGGFAATWSSNHQDGSGWGIFARIFGSTSHTYYGSESSDAFTGGEYDDALVGGIGNDNLVGKAGDDLFEGGAGADVLDGGDGLDMAFYSYSTEGVNIDLAAGTGTGGDAEGDTLSGIEDVVGSAHTDTLVGDDQANYLSGQDGDDSFTGGLGSDTISGGYGTDEAVFSGVLADYTVKTESGVVTVKHTATGDIDTVYDVESMTFDDVSIAPTFLTDGLISMLVGQSGAGRLEGYGSGQTFSLVDAPENGSVALNAEGTYSFTPTEGYVGSDSFSYQTVDANGVVHIGHMSINVAYAEADENSLQGSDGNDLLYGASSVTPDPIISHSLAFDGDDSMSWTPSGAGNSKTFTMSMWAGKNGEPVQGTLFSAGNDSNNYCALSITAAGNILLEQVEGGAATMSLLSDEALGADDWSHVVLSYDTNQSSQADRVKITVNNAELTMNGAGASLGMDFFWNTAGVENTIGTHSGAPSGLKGRLSDVYFIDGRAMEADSFAEFHEERNLWLPKEVEIPGIDVWSSNLCVGGTIGYSSTRTDSYYKPTHAFNGTTADWGWMSAEAGAGEYIQYTLPEAKVVKKYMVGSGMNPASYGRNPKDWELQGYNEATREWDVLHTVTGEVGWAKQESHTYDVLDNDTAYLQYRLNLVANDGGTAYNVGEIQLFGIDEVITYDTNGFRLAYNNSDNLGLDSGHADEAQQNTWTINGSPIQEYVSPTSALVVDDANDRIEAGSGDDNIYGAAGNDTLLGGEGRDFIDGGLGSDTASYESSTEGVNINLNTGTGFNGDAEGDVLVNVENLAGSAYDDTLTGDDNTNTLNGGIGDDTLSGGAGADFIHGGSGVDTASYAEQIGDYRVTINSTSTLVENLTTGDIDTLTDIETLVFSDTSYTARPLTTGSVSMLQSEFASGRLDGHDTGMVFSLMQGPANGEVTINNDGTYSFTPTVGYHGTDSFTYQAVDDDGITCIGRMDVDVSAHSSADIEGTEGNDLIYGASGLGLDEYLQNSLAFGGDDSMIWTPSGSGNGARFTLSMWIGENEGIAEGTLFSAGVDGDNYTALSLTAESKVLFEQVEGGVSVMSLTSDEIVDVESWAHIVLTHDTTQTSQMDRLRISIDNTELTLTGTGASQGLLSNLNTPAITNYIGAKPDGSAGLNGRITEVIFVDGKALAADSFGAFDADTSSWLRKEAVIPGDPVWSGNICDGGTIGYSSSRTDSYYKPTHVFNGTTADWGWMSDGASAGQYIQYTLPEAKVVNKYMVASGMNPASYGRNPKDWELQGYNEETGEWDILHIVTGEVGWAKQESHTYDVPDNDIAYLQYRLNLVANDGGSAYNVGEFQLFEVADTIVYDANGFKLSFDQVDDYGLDSSNESEVSNNSWSLNGSPAHGGVGPRCLDESGDDTIVAGAGDDNLYGAGGADVLMGELGADILDGGQGADVLDGGDGIDTASYSASSEGVNVDLLTGTGTGGEAEGDTLVGIENVIGSDHNDTFTGDDQANTFEGGLGDDQFIGSAGSDTIDGGDGSDTVSFAGAINDHKVIIDGVNVTVEHVATGDIDTLNNIENLSFSDASLTPTSLADGTVSMLVSQSGSGRLSGYDAGMAFSLVDGPDNGSVFVNADGTYTYTPSSGYLGTDSFSYQAIDADGVVRIGHMSVDVGYEGSDGSNASSGTDGHDLLYGSSSTLPDPIVGHSLKLDGDDSMSWTPSGAGNSRTFTLSMWVDGDGSTPQGTLLSAGDDEDNYSALSITSEGKVLLEQVDGGVTAVSLLSDEVLSADDWSHIVLSHDTSQPIQAERISIAVNNTELTLTGTGAPLNLESLWSTLGVANYIGKHPASSTGYVGRIADVNFIDGRAFNAESFGDFDTEFGAWLPKDAEIPGIDVWSSNLCVGGTIGYSSTRTDSYYKPTHAFNGTIADWGWMSAGAGAGEYVQYTLPEAKVVKKYMVASGMNPASYGRNPKDWELQGYNEGTGEWDVLHTVTGEVGWAKQESHTYDVPDNDTAYFQYRLYLVANDGGNAYNVGEVQLFEVSEVITYDTNGYHLTFDESDNLGRDTGHVDDTSQNNWAVVGSPSQDYVTPTSSMDVIDDADDVLSGGVGDDNLYGAGGNDLLNGGAGADILDGGDGVDTASYESSTEGVNVDLAAGTALGGEADGDVLISIENVTGSAHDDTLAGDSNNNTLDGGAGIDTVTMVGSLADYTVSRSASVITLVHTVSGATDTVTNVEELVFDDQTMGFYDFEDVNDVVVSTIADAVVSGLCHENDSNGLIAKTGTLPTHGAVTLNGDGTYAYTPDADYVGFDGFSLIFTDSDGNETEQHFRVQIAEDPGAGQTITGHDLPDAMVGGTGADTLSGGVGSDSISGNAGDDQLEGGSGNDTIQGEAGVDSLCGGEGTDILSGGMGNDILSGGAGSDILIGGSGFDVAEYSDSDSAVVVDLVTQAAIGGYAEGDMLSGVEGLVGSDYNDVLTGDTQANLIEAGLGDDTLSGGEGADTLDGGTGDDAYLINPGDGQDSIQDSSGNDTVLFGDGTTESDLWFTQNGNDLTIGVIGSSDKVTVEDWYTGSENRIEEFQLNDGAVLLESQVQLLVDAMSAYTPTDPGILTVPDNVQDDVQSVITANWDRS